MVERAGVRVVVRGILNLKVGKNPGLQAGGSSGETCFDVSLVEQDFVDLEEKDGVPYEKENDLGKGDGAGEENLGIPPRPSTSTKTQACDQDGNINHRWSTLFGIKPLRKSSFPTIKDVLDKERGKYAIEIPDKLVDHKITTIYHTFVGKFVGSRPNIDIVRMFGKNKWDLKGHVQVAAMVKGFLSFEFSYKEDLDKILCVGT